MTAQKLIHELDNTLSGQPWYGSPVLKLIEKVNPENAHTRSCGPHSSADILLHMIAWTEETNDRLKGKYASDPARGDWPDPAHHTWIELNGLFVLCNKHLKDTVVKMDGAAFSQIVNDDREDGLAERITYEELIRGIIQHHVYHSAQIALLNK